MPKIFIDITDDKLRLAYVSLKKLGFDKLTIDMLLCLNMFSLTPGDGLTFNIRDFGYSIVGYENRLTNTNFAVYITNTKNPTNAFYFKSAIEMVSFMQRIGVHKAIDMMNENIFVSMNGFRRCVIDNYQNYYKAKNIYICLDNPLYSGDVITFTNELKKTYKFKTYYPGECKSWNDSINNSCKAV